MSVVKAHRKRHNFSIIDNTGAESRDLSWKAKGVLWYLLTKPDNWTVRQSDLVLISPKEGRDSVAAAFKELEDKGYAFRRRRQNEKGKIHWETHIFETPQDKEEWLRSHTGFTVDGDHNGFTVDGSSTHGRSVDGKPASLVNTDIEITDQINTDLDTTDAHAQESQKSGVEVGSAIQTEIGFDQPLANPFSQPSAQATEASKLASVKQSEVLEEKVSSGAPQSFPKKVNESHFEWFRLAYNENKPRLWAKCTGCSKSRLKLLNRLVADFGDQSLDVLVKALKHAASDPWWSQKFTNGCFDSVFEKNRYTQWFEKYQESEASSFDRPTPLATAKQQQRFNSYMQALGA